MITKLKSDLINPECSGFFVETNEEDSYTARKINRWQWEMTYEHHTGRTYTETLDYHQVVALISDVVAHYGDCVYRPHLPTATRWSDEKIDRFIRGLCPQMCKTVFGGFILSADGAETLRVLRRSPAEWYVNGRLTNFRGVLNATKETLHKNFQWKYEAF